MDYVGRIGNLLSSLNNFYNEINPATLSGAIDIIVVEQEDGDLASSPFHVRFGKLSVLLPQEKKVILLYTDTMTDFGGEVYTTVNANDRSFGFWG
jgi:phosphatidate phosphatase LPIN